VEAGRARQRDRFSGDGRLTNGRMARAHLKTHCRLDGEGESLLAQAVRELGLSARAHDKILKVARTIADIDASAPIRPDHLAEAIQYRSLDRSHWA